MPRSLVALLALVPAAQAFAPDAPAATPSVKAPAGAVVYRPECFGYPEAEGTLGAKSGSMPRASGGGSAAGPNTVSAKKPSVSTPPSAPPPPPPPSPAPSPSKAAEPQLSKEFLDRIPAGRTYQSAVQTVPGSTDASPKDKRSRGDDADGVSEAEETVATTTGKQAPAPEVDRKADETVRGPVQDWGGTVYLSNDDSMSLASAQRLLYATMNRLPFSTREVRPHELLNYFSFDNVTPDADQMFDVLASAEQDGDQLSVALAVRGATPPPQPLDLTLVVDRSCSMADAGRMDFTRRGLTLMTDQLRQGDRLDVVLFDDGVCVPLENYVVGRDDPSLLTQTLRQMQPEGSTDVGLGLRTAYGVAKSHLETHGRNRRVMIVTDAMMNTGDVDPNTVSEIGKAYEADGIRLTGVGVGRDFNDTVLDMLTEKGKGAYVFLGSEAVVDRVFGEAGFGQLVQTVAHDVHFALKLPPSLAMERFYGEESSTVKEEVQPVHYYAGTTQLFLQDLTLKGGKVVSSDPVELVIDYRNAATGEPETRTFRTTVGAMVKADPHNVRKGLALMAWSDMLMAEAMGADPCGSELRTYAGRAGKLPDDAEIGFVNGLVRGRCGAFDLPTMVTNKGVPFKVRVDSDIPISTAALSCGDSRSTEALTASDAIAMFTAPPGVCELTLSGTVAMTAQVEVPTTGGGLRCVVRGGRIACS